MEDPTIAICRGLLGVSPTSLPPIDLPQIKLIPISENDIVGNRQLYSELDRVKSQFDHVNSAQFTKARNLANPFEQVVSDYFMTRAATKLANIDAVFGLTPIDKGRFTSTNPYRYVDLGAAPGSFSQYLQYRFPHNSLGYAFSLSPDKGGLAWKPEHLRSFHWVNNPVTKVLQQTPLLFLLPVPKNYPPVQSDIVTGDLITEYPAMIQFIGTKVDLIVSDAAFENGGTTLALENGFIHLFAAQLLIIAQTLLPGGHCCIKLFSSTTASMLALLCIARTLFDQMYIFKPMSSRPGSDERYFVGLGRNNLSAPDIVVHMLTTNQFIKLATSTPETIPLVNTLINLNQHYSSKQLATLQNINAIIAGKTVTIDPTDYQMALSIWNIPR